MVELTQIMGYESPFGEESLFSNSNLNLELKIKISKIRAQISEQTKNLNGKKEKYIRIDFEILHQPVLKYKLQVFKNTMSVFEQEYSIPNNGKTGNKTIKSNEKELIAIQPGKYHVLWDCSNNDIFDKKSENQIITFKIQVTGLKNQILSDKSDFLIGKLTKNAEINNYIIVLGKKGEEIKVYANDILERQRVFLSKIPNNVITKLSSEGKLILNLPIILTKLNFLHGALCQIHWLEGSKTSLKFPYEFFMSEERVKDIDRLNLEEYFKNLSYLSVENLGYRPSNDFDTNLFLFNDSVSSIKRSLEKFNKLISKAKAGDHIGDFNNLATELNEKTIIKENFFQSFSMGSSFGDIDSIGVALGRFSQRCYFKAFLTKNKSDNKWVISIIEVQCRFFDNFSFNDNLIDIGPIEWSQPLGCWYNDTEQVQLPSKTKSPGSSRVCLQNVDYIELKKALSLVLLNSCNDFAIHSELKSFTDDFIQKDIIVY